MDQDRRVVSISDAAKILSQIDTEREALDKESCSYGEKINQILSEAFERVKEISFKQEQIIQRRVELEALALKTLLSTVEK